MRLRFPNWLLAAYLLVALAATIWPGYAWAGTRIEPTVGGLPFALAWSVGWVLATFVTLCLYHLGRRA